MTRRPSTKVISSTTVLAVLPKLAELTVNLVMRRGLVGQMMVVVPSLEDPIKMERHFVFIARLTLGKALESSVGSWVLITIVYVPLLINTVVLDGHIVKFITFHIIVTRGKYT